MDLVLGPLLRYVDRSSATVWVETTRPCEVEVLGHRDRTFEVGGHHFGLVVVDLTGHDEVTPYTIRLDGQPAWPEPDDPRPRPVIRKPSADRTCLVFGSCRASAPDTEPWTLPRADDPRGFGIDALEAYARRLAQTDHETWSERICDGAWGPLGRRAGEAVRRAFDLEHWAAFRDSQARVLDLLREVATDPDVRHVVLLAGDVHNGSIDRATWPGVAQPLWQVVASPMRQEVEPAAARAFSLARSPWGRRIGGTLRRLAGGTRPQVSWRTMEGPVLRNHVAVLEASAQGEIEVRFLSTEDGRKLGTVITRRLARDVTTSG